MTLHLGHFDIHDLVFGDRTAVMNRVLTIDRDDLVARILEMAPQVTDLDVSLVRPGESTRIVCVKDVIQPRTKVDGSRIGQGHTHALRNVAVATCGQIVGYQEGLIDMSGPGATRSPFASQFLVAIEATVDSNITPHDHERTLRETGMKAAIIIGECVTDLEPDETELIDVRSLPEGLPRIAYLCMLLSQGLLHDSYVLGRNANSGLPTAIEPAELLDTAIVSGNCVSACDKNTTWHHQNNPVVRELVRRHGQNLNFAGVVLTNEPTRLQEKRDAATSAVALLKSINADGVVISKEGFGNPDADLMMIIRELESLGIRTVAITDEYAGDDGGSPSLADTTPEADAIVSTGNANERITLPRMDRLVGPIESVPHLAGASAGSVCEDGTINVELQVITGSTNQMGHQCLRGRTV